MIRVIQVHILGRDGGSVRTCSFQASTVFMLSGCLILVVAARSCHALMHHIRYIRGYLTAALDYKNVRKINKQIVVAIYNLKCTLNAYDSCNWHFLYYYIYFIFICPFLCLYKKRDIMRIMGDIFVLILKLSIGTGQSVLQLKPRYLINP